LVNGKNILFEKAHSIYYGINVLTTVNPITFYADGTVDKVNIYVYTGPAGFYKDLSNAVNKELDIGQIQTIAHTTNIYTITTQPSIGRIKIVQPADMQ